MHYTMGDPKDVDSSYDTGKCDGTGESLRDYINDEDNELQAAPEEDSWERSSIQSETTPPTFGVPGSRGHDANPAVPSRKHGGLSTPISVSMPVSEDYMTEISEELRFSANLKYF